MKISKKDILPFTIIIGGALGLTYLIFGTNIIKDAFLGSSAPQQANEQDYSGDGMNNFNFEVKKKEEKQFENKVEAYEEEIKIDQQKKEQEESEAKYKKENVRLNDLTNLMEEKKVNSSATTVDIKPLSQGNKENNKGAIKNTLTQPVVSKPTKPKEEFVNKGLDEKELEKKTKRRVRNSDPSFGDETEGSTVIENKIAVSESQKLYTALIHGRQKIVDGSRVMLRLTEPIHIGACDLGVNTLLTAVASVYGSRINLKVKACQQDSPIYLTVFDYSDGNEGLYVENLNTDQQVKKDAVQQAVGEGARDVGVPIIDQVIQSASNRKMNAQTVTIESGKKVYLKEVSAK